MPANRVRLLEPALLKRKRAQQLDSIFRRSILVLFVHGINGTPRNFSALIENLDHSRYQAWVVNYPSGLALDTLGTGIAELILLLKHKYQLEQMHVVAHSMGGLVARRGINNKTGTGITIAEGPVRIKLPARTTPT